MFEARTCLLSFPLSCVRRRPASVRARAPKTSSPRSLLVEI